MMESHPQSTPSSDDTPPQSIDERYQLLSVQRRRVLLDVLADQSEPLDLSALAQMVAAFENRIDVDEVSPAKQDRVAVSLHHVHLPKLDDFGIVEYDTETRQVEARASRIYDLLA